MPADKGVVGHRVGAQAFRAELLGEAQGLSQPPRPAESIDDRVVADYVRR